MNTGANIKLGAVSSGDMVSVMPVQMPGDTVYAQALDGANGDVFSPNQKLHDQIMAKITHQQNALENYKQSGQYFAPIVIEQADNSKQIFILIAAGLAALYFFKRR